MKTHALILLTIAAALGSSISANKEALAATPDIFATVVQPVGVAATQNEVLVSQPYCVNDNQTGPTSPANWQIVKIDTSGSQAPFATLPSDPNYGIAGTPGILSNCEETYLAISPGTGGFPTGHVYATQGGHVYEFDSAGAFVQTLAIIPSLEVAFAHTSLVFDTAGSFGNKLIVVGTDSSDFGEIWTVDSSGTKVQLATLTNGGSAACNGLAGVPCFESPAVAPLTGPIGGTFPGWLFTVEPGFSGVAADIGALQPGHSTVTGVGGVAVPEAAHFVPSTACGFNDTANGKTYEFFNANFSAPGSGGTLSNTIYAYTTSAFTGLAGQLLVTTEGGSPGIVISTDANIDFTAFDSTIYNSEGSNFVQCVAPPTRPFVGGLTWGYWKTHTGSGHPRRDPTYNSLSATCPSVNGVGAITLDGDCDNSSDSFAPTVIQCGKASQCSQSADALFAGGNTGGSPNCSGTCSSLFAAQFLATQLNTRAFDGFGNAIYVNPNDPRFNGMTVSAIISALQADFDAFVDGTGMPNLGQDQTTLDAINNNESHTVLFTP